MEPQEQGFWQKDPQQAAAAQAPPAPPAPSQEIAEIPTQQPAPDQPEQPMPVMASQPNEQPEPLPAIAWQASESVHRERDMTWYIGIGVVGVIVALIAFFLLKSITFAILVVVMAAALIFFSMRPPRILSYELSSQGLQINENHYSLHDFRAFGIVQEDALYYVTLLPVKRFAPAVDLYFPQEYGEDIVDLVGSQIPMQTVKPDFVDRFTRFLRF